MARGTEGAGALDMSKFFDTNYHYMVPELDTATLTGEEEKRKRERDGVFLVWKLLFLGCAHPKRGEKKKLTRKKKWKKKKKHYFKAAPPDFSTYLDRVKRGQAAIGKAAAVPILIGPNTLVGLAKPAEGTATLDKAAAVKALVPHYEAVLKELKALGVPEVQMHEPILASQTANDLRADFEASYATLSGE